MHFWTRGRHVVPAVLVAALLSAAPAVSASAATPTGTVVGEVVTTSGAPIEGATVSLIKGVDTAEGASGRVKTDNSGHFTFSKLPTGRYETTYAEAPQFVGRQFNTVAVKAGKTTVVPTITLTHTITVTGTLTYAADGSPVAGAQVSASGPLTLGNAVATEADGAFSISGVDPGVVSVSYSGQSIFGGSTTTNVPEGQTGTVALTATPAGTVTAGLQSRVHKNLNIDYTSALVDGCEVSGYRIDTCNVQGDFREGTPGNVPLLLSPGNHTIRYQVRSPLSHVTRHVTKQVTVTAGGTVKLGTLLFKADPVTKATITTRHFRKGHATVVAVKLPTYTDFARPGLRTTLIVDGTKITRSHPQVTHSKSGAKQVIVTIPAARTKKATLHVSAVLHGTKARTGITTATVTLTH